MNTGNKNQINLQRYTWERLPPKSAGTSTFPGPGVSMITSSGTMKPSRAELHYLLDEIASLLPDPYLIDISKRLQELAGFRRLLEDIASLPPDPYLMDISRRLQELVAFHHLLDEIASLAPDPYLGDISRRLQELAGLRRLLDDIASLLPGRYLIDISGKLQELAGLHRLLDEIASPSSDPYLINLSRRLEKLADFRHLLDEIASLPPDPYLLDISRRLQELAGLRRLLDEMASLPPGRYSIDMSRRLQELADFGRLLEDIASLPSSRYLINLSEKSQEFATFRRLLHDIASLLPGRYLIDRNRKLQELARLHRLLDEALFPSSDRYLVDRSRKLHGLIASLPRNPSLIARSGRLNDLENYNRELEGEITELKKLKGQSKGVVKQNTSPGKFRSHPQTYIILFIVLCLLVTGIVKSGIYSFITNPCPSGSIKINASITMQPLLEQAKTDYQKQCSGTTIILNPGSGDQESLMQVEKNQANIGSVDTFAPSQKLTDNQTTVVIYAFVINSQDISLTNLTTQQIRDIYIKGVNNWTDVGKVSGPTPFPIIGVSYPATAGISRIFVRDFLRDKDVFPGDLAYVSNTPDIALQNVCQTPGAITYVPLYYAQSFPASHAQSNGGKGCPLRILSIDNKDPHDINMVRNGSYKFWNLEHLYTRNDATGLTQDFINYMFSDNIRTFASKNGYLSVADIPQATLRCHVTGTC